MLLPVLLVLSGGVLLAQLVVGRDGHFSFGCKCLMCEFALHLKCILLYSSHIKSNEHKTNFSRFAVTSEALYQRGKLYLRTDNLEKAMQDLQEAASKDPTNSKIRSASELKRKLLI
jgi:hypothetical protein